MTSLTLYLQGHSIAAAVEWVAGGAPGSHRPVSKSVLQGEDCQQRRLRQRIAQLAEACGHLRSIHIDACPRPRHGLLALLTAAAVQFVFILVRARNHGLRQCWY